jgi:hypothetical protein
VFSEDSSEREFGNYDYKNWATVASSRWLSVSITPRKRWEKIWIFVEDKKPKTNKM